MTSSPRAPRYIQVNIGRNIGDAPMSDSAWEDFQDNVAMAIVSASAGTLPNVSIHFGEGFWNDAVTGELVSEPSAYLSTIADVDLFALRTRLRALKGQYRQDSIALIAGSDLI